MNSFDSEFSYYAPHRHGCIDENRVDICSVMNPASKLEAFSSIEDSLDILRLNRQ